MTLQEINNILYGVMPVIAYLDKDKKKLFCRLETNRIRALKMGDSINYPRSRIEQAFCSAWLDIEMLGAIE